MIPMFKTIEEVKAVAEKFEAGKIVPRRVLTIIGKGEKKARSDLKFTRNVYRLAGCDRVMVYFIDYGEGNSTAMNYFIYLSGKHKNLTLTGATHGKSMNHFIGNFETSDEKALELINEAVFGVVDHE